MELNINIRCKECGGLINPSQAIEDLLYGAVQVLICEDCLDLLIEMEKEYGDD